MENCENCPETKKLFFQIKDMGIQMRAQELQIETVQQKQDFRDQEHETMIQNLTNRMDTVSQDLQKFKEEVRQDIQGIKDGIPDMFDSAVNKLLARMFRYVVVGVFIIICVVLLALSRPLILKGISEVYKWVETVQVSK